MSDRRAQADGPRESLFSLLGGTRAAIEATVPPLVFVAVLLVTGESIPIAAISAIVVSAVLAVVALARGRKPRAVVIGLLATVIAATIAFVTGEARNFFALRILSNAASALVWASSIVITWPLLGVIVGLIVGTKGSWRRDRVLLRAYQRASWVWVLQYLIRVVVFSVLWALDDTVALGVAQAVLTYPLVVACLAVSGWVLFASIPKGHPGIRHPQAKGNGEAQAA